MLLRLCFIVLRKLRDFVVVGLIFLVMIVICYFLRERMRAQIWERMMIHRLASEGENGLDPYVQGWNYAQGDGVPMNQNEAIRLWRESAERGSFEAQFTLGEAYSGMGFGELHSSKGWSQQIDHLEAVKWYRMAAENGYAKAQFRLGEAYNSGQGVPKDPAEAFRWWTIAAERGDSLARFRLAETYFTQKKMLIALAWLNLVNEEHISKSHFKRGLAEDYKNLKVKISEILKPEDIKDAKVLSEELLIQLESAERLKREEEPAGIVSQILEGWK